MALDLSKIQQVLDNFRIAVENEANANLQSRHNANLRVTSFAKAMPRSFSLTFDLGDYGMYVDKGVNRVGSGPSYDGSEPIPLDKRFKSPFNFQRPKPSQTMVTNLSEWLQTKGGQTFESTKQLRRAAYGLGVKILRDGLKGSYFFTDAYRKHYGKMEDDVLEAFGITIDDFFNFVIKD